jgi:PAS domain S-box-containing protein
VVLEWRHGTSDQPSAQIIVLQGTDHAIFRARLDNASGIVEYRAGSRLQVTGVCVANSSGRSFQLLLRSADDLVLLERAAWWTPSHTLWVLEALLACGAVTLGWVWVLKEANARLERRVAERTEELGRSEERFRKLTACLPVGVVETDTQGASTYVNPRATEIAGRFAEGGAAIWPWSEAIHPDDRAGVSRSWAETARTGNSWSAEFRLLRPDGKISWVSCLASPRLDQTGGIAGSVVTIADITHRKRNEAELEEAHKQLVLSSRMAGMAEVATSVLHNVGNVLTSINISSSLIMDRVRNSKVANLGKAAALVQEHADDLPGFLADDPRGRQLPGYLGALSELLIKDHTELLEEMGLLNRNIEHINEIVAMQQNQGKVAGVLEQLPVASLVEDALRMNLGSMERHGVQIVREYNKVPAIQVDRHKVLQILVNLIRNAQYACDEGLQAQKRITLRVGLNGGDRVKIAVMDNGMGIARENLTRIFAHGFTTRKDGHGFGLHSGALAAKELGGALLVHSDGPGQGAVFTLELPLQPASPEQNGL